MNTNQMRLSPDGCTAGLEVRPSSTDRLHTWASQRFAALRRYQQRRGAIAELRRMSDWRLADLGIPRERIVEVVDGLIAREGPEVKGLQG